jgi:putative spermidine/putrescine transport system permease protein
VLRWVLDHLATVPFLAYVGVFLLWPTLTVVGGAFSNGAGGLTLDNVTGIFRSPYRESFVRSIELSAITAVLGAVLGAALAWAVVSGKQDGLLRRVVTSAAGVLAQFGGVTLAFAFLATIGFEGLITVFLRDHGVDLFASGAWIFELPGLVLVYSYFQVPLMVIVFLPALDGLRPQWREASESLGGTGWTYLRHVAGPILMPAFLGSVLLLFANAFSAYATAAALISQGATIVPLQIRALQTSEVVLGQQGQGKALGLGMVVVVAVVMGLYALLQRRTSRWLR